MKPELIFRSISTGEGLILRVRKHPQDWSALVHKTRGLWCRLSSRDVVAFLEKYENVISKVEKDDILDGEGKVRKVGWNTLRLDGNKYDFYRPTQ